MKHRIGYNKLGRTASHRKALVKNMVTQLYRHERIRTTRTKALEVRRRAEKFITRAKEDTLHNRRIVAKSVQDKAVLAKLFTEIAPGFVDRPGGYTRILKLGYRRGDAAEMVLLELVTKDGEAPTRKKPVKATGKKESAKAATDTILEESADVTVESADSETENGAAAGATETDADADTDVQR